MKYLFCFIAIGLTVGCNTEVNELDKLEGLVGDWRAQMEENIIVSEHWTRIDKNTFHGASYFINRGDTTLSEEMTIEKVGDQIQFATILSNDEGQVVFPLKIVENDRFVFEKLKNEYPQRIIYKVPTKDSLHAYIEGNLNGEATKLDFFFKKN
ncbi:MAG: hypothetical protein ACI9XP_000693 [Lentimonas sp.]|jgi:hypothetical protein